MIFFPNDKSRRQKLINIIEKVVYEEGQKIIYWRDVPVDSSVLGVSVKSNEPCIKQVFIEMGDKISTENEFERKLYIIRKQIFRNLDKNIQKLDDFYIPSLSTRTIVYKGMVLAPN